MVVAPVSLMLKLPHLSPAILLSALGVAVMFFVVQSIIFLYPASRLKGVALAGGLGFVNA